jgi:hypothetical protein
MSDTKRRHVVTVIALLYASAVTFAALYPLLYVYSGIFGTDNDGGFSALWVFVLSLPTSLIITSSPLSGAAGLVAFMLAGWLQAALVYWFGARKGHRDGSAP